MRVFYSKTACAAYKIGRADKFSKSVKFIGVKKRRKMKFLDRLGVDRSSFIDLFSACLGCDARMQEMGSKLIVKGRRRSVDFERGETLFGDDAPCAICGISAVKQAAAARGRGVREHKSPR